MRSCAKVAAVVLWSGFALAGDIEIFHANEIQPDSPRSQTPRLAAPVQQRRSNDRATPQVQQELPGRKVETVLWEARDTSLTLPANVPLDLQSGDRAVGAADLKLVGFELTSEAGQLAQVDRATWQVGPSEVPAGQWQAHIPAHRGSNLCLLRLGHGRYARILLGTTEMDWDSAKASSPGDIAQPTAFKLVSIRYWLSDPSGGKTDTRRITGGKLDPRIDPRLAGTWKMTRPGGAMIADVPGAGDTIITRVGGWSATDRGMLSVSADDSYRWKMPDGQSIRGRCYRIRPASPAIGHTYWAVEGLGDDGFITFDPEATHETSDGLWAGNRIEPMAIGGRRQ